MGAAAAHQQECRFPTILHLSLFLTLLGLPPRNQLGISLSKLLRLFSIPLSVLPSIAATQSVVELSNYQRT